MSVDVVAVGLNPIAWAVYCELCIAYIGEPTQDEDFIDQMYEEHCLSHGLTPEN
jgi:hypothetical protein